MESLVFILSFVIFLGSKIKNMGGFAIIWHALMWTILNVCNDKLFYDSLTNVKKLEEKSFFLS